MKKLVKDDVERLTVNFTDKLISKYFLPGKVENWVVIADFKNASISSLLGNFKFIGSILEKNYRTKLFRFYMVNTPWMINLLFVFLKTFDRNIQKKIINSRQNCNEVWWTHIEKNQIEEQYGGDMPNKTFTTMEDLGL